MPFTAKPVSAAVRGAGVIVRSTDAPVRVWASAHDAVRSYDGTMAGAAEAGNYQGQRLLKAATAALEVLGESGFKVRETDLDEWRGAGLTVASQSVAIHVGAEWWDRELAVWVQVAGAQAVPVEKLIPELRGTLRLPRDATPGVLKRRLERIVRALQTQMPEVLADGQDALDRVLRAGAEPA